MSTQSSHSAAPLVFSRTYFGYYLLLPTDSPNRLHLGTYVVPIAQAQQASSVVQDFHFSLWQSPTWTPVIPRNESPPTPELWASYTDLHESVPLCISILVPFPFPDALPLHNFFRSKATSHITPHHCKKEALYRDRFSLFIEKSLSVWPWRVIPTPRSVSVSVEVTDCGSSWQHVCI